MATYTGLLIDVGKPSISTNFDSRAAQVLPQNWGLLIPPVLVVTVKVVTGNSTPVFG